MVTVLLGRNQSLAQVWDLSVAASGICGFAAPVVDGLAAAMLCRPVAGIGGVCSRDWSASIRPCSGARSCGSAGSLAALDLTARGTCILGRAVAWGAGSCIVLLLSGPARLVGSEESLLSGSTGGAAETAGKLDSQSISPRLSPLQGGEWGWYSREMQEGDHTGDHHCSFYHH